jgi:hypothetical protein
MTPIMFQALGHIPALLLIWLIMYATFWCCGIVNWPRLLRRENILAKWGAVDIGALGGFRLSSLALISLTGLFLELLLIRWIASEIRVFAYFKSLVLIACFLGFGIGCYLTRRTIYLVYTLAPLLALTFIVELPWDPLRHLIRNLSNFIAWFSDVHMWSRSYFQGQIFLGTVSAGVAMSIVIPLFGLIAITFVPLGQLVGWYLENSKNGILAYSVNVLASIAGIWLYTALCFRSTPPVVWFLVLGLMLLIYLGRLPKARAVSLACFMVIVALFGIGTRKRQWWGEESWKGSLPAEHVMEPGKIETFWSPYQKLTLIPLQNGSETLRYILNTNDSWYQQIIDLSPAAIAKNPDLYAGTPVRYHQYNLPYQFYPRPRDVLIAGAGMGNDAAAALRNGATRVTAVEIDPLIYAKGKDLHFEAPYRSDAVTVHVDDARAFIQNTTQKFDLVVFSILDSHTTTSYYTNIRLDNYVYTLEGLQAARKLVKDDGAFVMSFSSERPWFTQRLRDLVTRAFGKEPLMIQPDMSFFVVAPGDRIARALEQNPELKQFATELSDVRLDDADATTDDWPYLYQQYRGIPLIVWLLSSGLIAICWLTFRKLKQSAEGIQWHFFFLGAAFMLLEVQIISKAALLFGTTWLVNSIVITCLLLFILLSNAVLSVFPDFPRGLAYAGLFGTLALSHLVPISSLWYESMLVRAAVSTGLYCAPVFFAGLIFTSSFRLRGFRAEAFGSNLLGALVGGLLEALSYWLGIKALVLVAGLLYGLSLVSMERATVEVSGRARLTPAS